MFDEEEESPFAVDLGGDQEDKPGQFTALQIQDSINRNKASQAQLRALYEQAAERLRQQRFGPSKEEKWLAISAALGQPTKTGSFGESLGNVTQALLGTAKARREGEAERQSALEKLQLQRLQSEMTGNSALDNLLVKYAQINKPPAATRLAFDAYGRARDPHSGAIINPSGAAESGATGPAAPPAVRPQGKLDPKQFFKDFVLPHEGGFNPSDANGAPVNFGINQAANPEVDVRKLTPEKAAQIFTDKYFAQSGAADLPPALAAAHADTSYINPSAAKRILRQSDGDVGKYLTLRQQWMDGLVARDPKKFGKYEKAWTRRTQDLGVYAQKLETGEQAVLPVANDTPIKTMTGAQFNKQYGGNLPSDVTVAVDPAGKPDIIHKPEAPKSKENYRLLSPEEAKANGLDPNIRYQMAANGMITAVGGQTRGLLKPVPPAASKAMIENRDALRQIDSAIKAVQMRPHSIGPGTGMLGDTVTQYNDPKGTDTRAAVGKIAGQIIHDVSGAAVTMSEEPRFRPYVATVTDRPEVALDKLKNLRALLAGTMADYESQYSEEQGYRPFKFSQEPKKPSGFKILKVRPK